MSIQINFADAATIGKRDEQQDYKANLVVEGGYILYVLADGMGGQIGGATASREVTNGFLDFFKQHGAGQNPEQNLRAALDQANNRLTDILRTKPEMNGMGTTVIAMLYKQSSNQYWFLSVGDSPLYLKSQSGIKRLNVNHAYYEDLLKKVKKGEISQQEADEHPQRHAITSAVMGKSIALIDTGSGQLLPNELILLASDGVQTLNDLVGGELESILMSQAPISKQVDTIIQQVNNKNSPYQDNTTLILVEPVYAKKGEDQESSKTIREPESFVTDVPPQTAAIKKSNSNGLIALIMILSFLLGGIVVFYLLSSDSPSVEPQEVLIQKVPPQIKAPVIIEKTLPKPVQEITPSIVEPSPQEIPYVPVVLDTPVNTLPVEPAVDGSSSITVPAVEVAPKISVNPQAASLPEAGTMTMSVTTSLVIVEEGQGINNQPKTESTVASNLTEEESSFSFFSWVFNLFSGGE